MSRSADPLRAPSHTSGQPDLHYQISGANIDT
jgi:hypothetical protein